MRLESIPVERSGSGDLSWGKSPDPGVSTGMQDRESEMEEGGHHTWRNMRISGSGLLIIFSLTSPICHFVKFDII